MRLFQTSLLFAGLYAASAQQFDDFVCPDEFEGYYPHDLSCDRYWECKKGVATLETCGNGLAFDDLDPTYTTKNCDYIYNVECNNRTELEPAISAPNCPRLFGTFPDEDDCTGFYNCRDGLANRFSCAPGLAFDPNTRVCKWADQVQACKAQRDTEEEGDEFVCPRGGPIGIFTKHAHPADCRQYFVCISGTPREYGCPLGTVFKISEGDGNDGKCTDPEEVPECANYYGDLEFDKQELVKAGVDPEAVGARVIAAPRTRVSRPTPRAPEPVATIEEDDDDFILPAPVRPATTNSDSFRPSVSRNRLRTRPQAAAPAPAPVREEAPVRVAPPVPSRTRPRPQVALPEPVNVRPVTEAPIVAPPAPVVRAEVPAIPLATLVQQEPAPVPSLIPAAAPASRPAAAAAAPAGGLGQPAKVKAGEDYYYYYYYYDDDEEYPGDGEAADAATA